MDLSLNRIQASWKEISSLAAELLGKQIVQYLNLDYLPALQILNDNPPMQDELHGYQDKLSLGLNNSQLIDEPDTDFWTQSAWVFKHVAYGEDMD